MELLFLDAETYYDDQYSLTKLPIPNYIHDPRFELQMVAVKRNGEPSSIVDGPDFPAYLKQFDPENTTTITFNSLFDNSILAWRYGFVPRRMVDTMGMARALRGHMLPGASLEVVSRVLGLGDKGKAILKVKGMKRADIIAAGLWPEFSGYAIQDNDLNAGIFSALWGEFAPAERVLMDLVLRCAVVPRFMIDTALLEAHIADVQDQKALLLRECGVGVADLMSNDKFKAALEAQGVVVGYKTSPTTGKTTPAFAKTDAFMSAIQEHDNPTVQALAAARLGHKSTIEETRARKLLSIGILPWSAGGGTMPIPLRYGGAHTHRLSGDWGLNMQNLPSSRKAGSKLRKALIAPPGHKVVTCDLGQIEARLVAWFCGCELLMQQFADNLDPYARLGEAIFGYPVDRKVQKVEGFIGKTGILGLGFGCGADKFFGMVQVLARTMGMSLGEIWTKELAKQSVDTYRETYPEIPKMWRKLDGILRTVWIGKQGFVPEQVGPVIISQGEVMGPTGIAMRYANARFDVEADELRYSYGRFSHKIYGAKMLENIIQFLARVVVMQAAIRLANLGYPFVLQAHDELVFIVKDEMVDRFKVLVHQEMTRRPSWAPTIPLTAEVGVGQSYGEAK